MSPRAAKNVWHKLKGTATTRKRKIGTRIREKNKGYGWRVQREDGSVLLKTYGGNIDE